MRFWLVFAMGCFSLTARARVFDFKDFTVSPYVRGTGGLSQLNQDAFGNSSGATTVGKSSAYNYGAEIGLALALTKNFHFKLGAEIIDALPVHDQGKSSGGTPYYDLQSDVFIFNPNAGFEFVGKTWGDTRMYGELGAGYANVTVTNDYKMTAAGAAALGVSDFKETMDANTISGYAGMGFETLFTDNVTFSADLGYRYLPVNSLKYKAAVNNIVSPSGAAAGSDVVNADGSKRKLNLGGLFMGVTFRFYLSFI